MHPSSSFSYHYRCFKRINAYLRKNMHLQSRRWHILRAASIASRSKNGHITTPASRCKTVDNNGCWGEWQRRWVYSSSQRCSNDGLTISVKLTILMRRLIENAEQDSNGRSLSRLMLVCSGRCWKKRGSCSLCWMDSCPSRLPLPYKNRHLHRVHETRKPS